MRAKAANIKRVEGDVRYNSLEVAKIINRAMIDGKKIVAEKQVYKAMDIIAEKTGAKALDVLMTALNNIKPKTEVRQSPHRWCCLPSSYASFSSSSVLYVHPLVDRVLKQTQ